MREKKFEVQTISWPFLVEKFRDGEAYQLPKLRFIVSNRFMAVTFVDEVFIKLPAQQTLNDYFKYLIPGHKKPWTVRRLEKKERFEHLEEQLQDYPEFLAISEHYDPETAHYLLLFKMQYQRLKTADLIHLPETRFAVTEIDGVVTCGPAVIQYQVPGTNIFDMLDDDGDYILPEWKHYIPIISEKFARLLDSELREHLDWNIRNFMICKNDHQIYYIDSKPSVLFSKPRNEYNIKFVGEVLISDEHRHYFE